MLYIFYRLMYRKTVMTSLKLVKEASKVLLGIPRIDPPSDIGLLAPEPVLAPPPI